MLHVALRCVYIFEQFPKNLKESRAKKIEKRSFGVFESQRTKRTRKATKLEKNTRKIKANCEEEEEKRLNRSLNPKSTQSIMFIFFFHFFFSFRSVFSFFFLEFGVCFTFADVSSFHLPRLFRLPLLLLLPLTQQYNEQTVLNCLALSTIKGIAPSHNRRKSLLFFGNVFFTL